MENPNRLGAMAERRPTQQRQRRPVHEQPQVPRVQTG
jgi:hypothetical protein